MARYIAFLRAINVGGHTVKMNVLRELFESLELTNVETFIASGNVLFDSAARNTSTLEQRIEQHLERALGYEVPTFIRTPAQLEAIGCHEPAAARTRGPAKSLYVGFLKAAPTRDAEAKLLGLRSDIDAFDVDHREIYWSCTTSMSTASVTGAQLERALKMPTTFRSITTIRKLGARH